MVKINLSFVYNIILLVLFTCIYIKSIFILLIMSKSTQLKLQENHILLYLIHIHLEFMLDFIVPLILQ